MVRSVQQLLGVVIDATDGPIGHIHDVYFDDHTWLVRYYVVDTGMWLPGRKVLIPPGAFRTKGPDEAGMPVNLTREQVRNSPDVDTKRPISRQAEMVLYRHYGWAPYWIGLEPATPIFMEGNAAEREREATAGHYGGEPHLRSANEMAGYHVAASDGEIGHIEDCLIDEDGAKIRYAVVDTRNWLPGKRVLIAPEWIREIRWSESRVFVNATREAVRNSPEYNPVIPVGDEYEAQLYAHYGFPGPWL